MSAQPRFVLELSCGSRLLGDVGLGGGAMAWQTGGCREPGNRAQDGGGTVVLSLLGALTRLQFLKLW